MLEFSHLSLAVGVAGLAYAGARLWILRHRTDLDSRRGRLQATILSAATGFLVVQAAAGMVLGASLAGTIVTLLATLGMLAVIVGCSRALARLDSPSRRSS